MMPLKRATLLRGSASPRANFFWRATQNGYCFAAALCVNSPRTALRVRGNDNWVFASNYCGNAQLNIFVSSPEPISRRSRTGRAASAAPMSVPA